MFGRLSLSPERAIVALRVAVCALVFIHGVYRGTTGGYAPFGQWLTGQGVPFGPAVAIFITGFEILAAPVLAFGLYRRILSSVFVLIYAAGAVMVHLPEGWFVVGAGRNGVEYSVLLIVCFILAGWTAPKAPSGMSG